MNINIANIARYLEQLPCNKCPDRSHQKTITVCFYVRLTRHKLHCPRFRYGRCRCLEHALQTLDAGHTGFVAVRNFCLSNREVYVVICLRQRNMGAKVAGKKRVSLVSMYVIWDSGCLLDPFKKTIHALFE